MLRSISVCMTTTPNIKREIYVKTVSCQYLQDGRVHCSLNINTETGRLSCRRPNLQNQPALEKDRYFIRKAFRAEEGNKLVVADYGQLELRILAHMTVRTPCWTTVKHEQLHLRAVSAIAFECRLSPACTAHLGPHDKMRIVDQC